MCAVSANKRAVWRQVDFEGSHRFCGFWGQPQILWILRAAADFGDLAAAGKTSILGRACKLGSIMLSSGNAPKWINRIQRLLDKRRYTTFCKYKVTATFQEDGTTKVPKGLLRILILSRSWQKRQQAICSESHKFYNGLKFQCWRAINMFEVSFGFVL